jgi:hypothetical protein
VRRLQDFSKEGREDPRLEARAPILLETLVGSMPLKELLYVPSRLREMVLNVAAIGVTDPLVVGGALRVAAEGEAAHYAADYAFVAMVILKEVRDGKPLDPEERKVLLEAAGRWLETWRPKVKTLPYCTDLLGASLTALAGYPGNGELRKLLKEHDIAVRDYVDPKGVEEKRKEPAKKRAPK